MSEETDAMIERYMDNLMSPQERADFEQRLRREPGLAAQVQRQHDVDAALRRLLQVPDTSTAHGLVARLAGATATKGTLDDSAAVAGRIAPARSAMWTKWLAAAAIIAIVVGSSWFVWDQVRPMDRQVPVAVSISPAEYYRMKVDSGFKPSWKCENDAEFARSFNSQFGQPLLLRALPAGVAAGGIDYCTTLTPRSVGLLGNVNDQKVIVIVDMLSSDKPLSVPPESGLRLFRRELGNLVAYEVTPLEQSNVLDLLYVPDSVPQGPVSEEPTGNG